MSIPFIFQYSCIGMVPGFLCLQVLLGHLGVLFLTNLLQFLTNLLQFATSSHVRFIDFFSFLVISRHLVLFIFSFILLYDPLVWQIPRFNRFFFFFFWFLLGLIVWPRLADLFVPENPEENVCVLFFRTDSWLSIHHLFARSNFTFLHNSQWIPFPTQSCLVLYSFCTSLLYLLIM